MKKIITLIVLIQVHIFATEVLPISLTEFNLTIEDQNKTLPLAVPEINGTVSLKGEEFIVVSVRERGSDGRFYAVDRDGVVWWSSAITSGADDFKTPSGIYDVKYKKRYHMSKDNPSEDGVNNMDYSIFFTYAGHALHQGSTNYMSHGCIHVDPKDIPTIYTWAKKGMKIIITRKSYMPFAKPDLKSFNVK